MSIAILNWKFQEFPIHTKLIKFCVLGEFLMRRSTISRLRPAQISRPGPAVLFTQPAELLGSARTLMHEGHYLQAVKKLQSLLDEFPYHPPALCLLIKAAQKVDCFDVAERYVYAFEERYPEPNQQICAHLIDAYSRLGRSEDAEDVFKFAGDKSGASVHVVAARIRSLGAFNDIPKTFGLFHCAKKRELNPSIIYPALIFALESVFKLNSSCEKHLREAHREFSDAVLRGVKLPAMFESLMRMYCEVQRFSEAKTLLDQAIVLEVARDKTCIVLFSALYDSSRYQDIIDGVETLPPLLRNLTEIQFRRADALRKTRQYVEARQVLSEIERRGVSESEYYKLRIIDLYILDNSGEHVRAFNLFRLLLERIPPTSRHLPRAICGFVFCWKNNSSDRTLVDPVEARLLVRQLDLWLNQYSNNMRRDIVHAKAILREAYPE